MARSNETSDRATFSSLMAVVSAIALAAFTWTSAASIEALSVPMKLVVAWSYAMSAALVIWASRDWLGIHWIGNPTLSMIAGASGSSIAAVALAFTTAGAVDQDKKVNCQLEVLVEQLRTLQRIESAVKQTPARAASEPVFATPLMVPSCAAAPISRPNN